MAEPQTTLTLRFAGGGEQVKLHAIGEWTDSELGECLASGAVVSFRCVGRSREEYMQHVNFAHVAAASAAPYKPAKMAAY